MQARASNKYFGADLYGNINSLLVTKANIEDRLRIKVTIKNKFFAIVTSFTFYEIGSFL
jgi:hypothetical protein